MQLSKDISNKIDVLEYILPKLRLMTVEPSSKDDIRTPELRFIEFIEELSIGDYIRQYPDLRHTA